MARALRQLATCLALLGAMAMVFAPLLLSAHRAHVQHQRCLEHGELVEVSAGGGQHIDHHDPVVTTGHSDLHDAHCTVDEATTSTTVLVHSFNVVTTSIGTDVPVLVSASPRGPPLVWAPKTSPPSCA